MSNGLWIMFGVVGTGAVASLVGTLVRRLIKRHRPITLQSMLLANVLESKNLLRR
jgi:hypothetical protein